MLDFLNDNMNRVKFSSLKILLVILISLLVSQFEEYSSPITVMFIVGFIFLCIKRINNIGHSLWTLLLLFIPVVNFGFYMYLFLKKGSDTPHSNSFKKSSIPEEILNQKFDEVIDELINGKFSKEFSSNVLLKKNEVLIFDIPEISYCEERSVKFKGGTQGFSIRLMKGVSYRFGQFQGGVEKKVIDELRNYW